MPEDDTSPNTLGLAFDQLKIDETKVEASTAAEEPEQPVPPADTGEPRTEKKKPYVNHERVKTGGAQRDKLTEDELTERMARIKAQNDKIKQRRLDVEADEDAFRKMQESERAKIALNKKVQETVNRTREQNAKRKMDKIQSREWDSGKPAADWKHAAPANKEEAEIEESAGGASDSRWSRGSPRGRSQRGGNRGRGRGRGGALPPSQEVPISEPETVQAEVAATEAP